MNSGAGEPSAPAEDRDTPWYARGATLIGSGIAAAIGVILVVIGVVNLVGASSTRDEAAGIRDEAEELRGRAEHVARDAEIAGSKAWNLWRMSGVLERRIGEHTFYFNRQADTWQSLIDCTVPVIDAFDEAALVACFDEHLGPLQAAMGDQVEAVEGLHRDLLLADEALERARG